MRLTRLVLALLFTVAFAGSTFAVPPGKTVEYTGGSNGKVVFDGKIHAEKGLKCTDCHAKIFQMKKGPAVIMAEINSGKSCGACHNGQKAFKTSDPANCGKCHKK